MSKPRTPRPPPPIESFGAPIFNVLVEGAQRRIELPNLPYREAVKFRFRCHKLRNRMNEVKHEMASIAAKAKIRIEWDHSRIDTLFTKNRVPYPKDSNSLVTVIIEPTDEEFSEALKKAGLDPHRVITSEGVQPPEADTSTTSQPTLDQLLGDLK